MLSTARLKTSCKVLQRFSSFKFNKFIVFHRMFTTNCFVYSTVIKLILKNINSNKVLRAHTLFLILFIYPQSNFFFEASFKVKSNNRGLGGTMADTFRSSKA